MQKRIALFGSTGSIGQSTLKVVRHLPEDLTITVLAAKSNIELLEVQAREFSPKFVVVYDKDKALELQKRINVPVLGGLEGLLAAAEFEGADFALFAMSGTVGIEPAIAAIRTKKQIGLANKEILVSAGEMITRLAKEHGVELLPIDSEHSALFQCLEEKSEVRRLILTASGGPFLHREDLDGIGVEEALKHPNWKMGPKITIDSSTLMNKGLEMIEARWLFGIEQIEVVIHPQSIVHSMIEYVDGSILGQMSIPDMILPIQYALTYPRRKTGRMLPFDFTRAQQWSFFPPDRKKFPCLRLAEEALQAGRSYCCFLNGANEVLVERFIQKKISWKEIGEKLDKLISSHHPQDMLTLEAVLNLDLSAREIARKI